MAAGVPVDFLALGAGPAKAEPVAFSLDRGMINLGGSDGTWATLIDQTIPDPPVTINSDVTGATLTAGAGDFYFPPKRIEGLKTGNGILPVVEASIAITADGPLAGNFDLPTGQSTVNLPADVVITMYPVGPPASVARRRTDGFTLSLQLSGPGDPALDGMLGGPGGLWLAGEAGPGSMTVPVPTAQPTLTGTTAASTEQTAAKFQFEKDETEPSPVTGIECKLDADAFVDCSSRNRSYTDPAEGSHTFTVRSLNRTGLRSRDSSGPGGRTVQIVKRNGNKIRHSRHQGGES